MAQSTPNYAIVDVESTFFQKGNPFSDCNRLCLIGVRINALNTVIQVEYDQTTPYAEALAQTQRLIDSVDTLVLFNAKFDLNWLARYGIYLRDYHRVFDCQLAEFILGNQRPAYPSLDYCLGKYNLGHKLDIVATDYWTRGVDTPNVPLSILTEYLNEDLRLTDALYNRQLGRLSGPQQRLFNLQCQDLQVLQEMEFNGQLFNWKELGIASTNTTNELREIDARILEWTPDVVRGIFNIDSNDHLSVLLYGGMLRGKRATPYRRQYKTGPRAGETVDANRWETYEYFFKRLVEPRKGSELKKDGFYSTDEETLLSLSKPKPLIELLLKRAELAKLSQTYLSGIPKIAEKYDWKDGYIHGTFNQCRVITGRLSSEKPNQQNFPSLLNKFIVSRF